MTLRIRRFATDLCLLVLFFGCNNNVARVTIPDWDPSGFTQAILDKLDKNGNEAIDQPELAEAPGLTFGARFIDQNGDGKLGRDELEARFAKYRDIRVGLMPKELRVTYNGQPLVGADVRVVPEFFLQGTIESATGKTAGDGVVRPSIADQRTPLLRVGYYRVEVTSTKPQLPAKFNSQTSVGVEISPFAYEAAAAGTIEIPLRDRK